MLYKNHGLDHNHLCKLLKVKGEFLNFPENETFNRGYNVQNHRVNFQPSSLSMNIIQRYLIKEIKIYVLENITIKLIISVYNPSEPFFSTVLKLLPKSVVYSTIVCTR